MQRGLWERFKYWICDTFGHVDLMFIHVFNGKKVSTCKFCGRLHTEEVDDAH